jgi:tetratricopeptide (TPR) repeat protein
VTSATANASGKKDVLQAIDAISERLRRALGDPAPSDQFKAETFSAASLDAVKDYTVAQALSTDRRNDEAIAYYRKAIEKDPAFGRAYAGWAVAAYDSGRREEAGRLWDKAIAQIDQMTEREKYRTLGIYYLAVAHNNDKAIESYSELVKRYPADLAGHNNLAIAYFSKLDFANALKEGRRAIDLYPKSLKFRGNYALYAMYAGDFKTAAEYANGIIREAPTYFGAYLPLAMEALAAGRIADAKNQYQHAAATGAEGASLAAIGLADIALFEGRYADAAAILPPAIDADRQRNDSAGAAAKTIALAEAYFELRRTPAALKAIDEALALSREDSTLVPAARLLLQAGQQERARGLIGELRDRLQVQSRSYAGALEAERAIGLGRPGDAMDALGAATKLADLWLVRFTSGVAYERFGHHVEAAAEFDACLKRIGEATALFLDDEPTFRYTAPLGDWLRRAKAH